MIFAPTFSNLVFYEHPYWRSPCNTGPPSCPTARVYLSPAAKTTVDKDENDQGPQKKSEPTVLYRGGGVQVSQDENNSYIFLDLPGVRQDGVQVDLLDNGVLRVETERKSQNRIVTKRFTLDERSIDKTNIQANLVDGVLAIVLPKKEQEEVSDLMDITVTPDRFEDDNSSLKTTVVYTADIPGVAAKNVKVTFHKDKLFLQAERRRGEETVSKTRRCLQVDAKRVDTAKLQAFLADGVLAIVAPERQVPPPVRIVVGTNQTPASGEPDTLVETTSDEKAADQTDDSEEAVISAESVGFEEAAVDEEASNSDSKASSNKTKENGDWEEVDDAPKQKD